MEHTIVVYLMTFPHGKRYVGVTADLKRRMYQHKRAAKTGKYSSLVHKAINKYGEENVNVKTLGYFSNMKDALEYEKELIAQFDARDYGYNLTDGGQGRLGFKHTEETKRKLSKLKTGVKIKNPRRDFTIPASVKKKIAYTLGARPIEVYKNNVIIGTWTNLSKCASDLNVHRPNITHCLNGKLKTTGGYSFQYA